MQLRLCMLNSTRILTAAKSSFSGIYFKSDIDFQATLQGYLNIKDILKIYELIKHESDVNKHFPSSFHIIYYDTVSTHGGFILLVETNSSDAPKICTMFPLSLLYDKWGNPTKHMPTILLVLLFLSTKLRTHPIPKDNTITTFQQPKAT